MTNLVDKSKIQVWSKKACWDFAKLGKALGSREGTCLLCPARGLSRLRSSGAWRKRRRAGGWGFRLCAWVLVIIKEGAHGSTTWFSFPFWPLWSDKNVFFVYFLTQG